jgi:hypothetical protein
LLFVKAEANAQPAQETMEPNAVINEQTMKIPPITAVDLIQNIKYSHALNDILVSPGNYGLT